MHSLCQKKCQPMSKETSRNVTKSLEILSYLYTFCVYGTSLEGYCRWCYYISEFTLNFTSINCITSTVSFLLLIFFQLLLKKLKNLKRNIQKYSSVIEDMVIFSSIFSLRESGRRLLQTALVLARAKGIKSLLCDRPSILSLKTIYKS